MQELAAAEEAQKIIDTLSVTSPETPTIVDTLRKDSEHARRATTPILSSAVVLNASRDEVVLALNGLIGSLQARSLAAENIDRAKAAVDVWIKLLKGRS
jgi:hypothetical protein